ncbi:Uncharacterised protein [Candidatus Tiddalikarchaeum anstoanum]|nr:Uncharacterised protein [Candidatus Tiddalikarchaeum anstoanum]
MGIKCPKCKSTNTEKESPGVMSCKDCSHSWKPYKHRGKKFRTSGDGILTPIRKVMPGAKTRTIGDGILYPKKRVKKARKKKFSWSLV